MNKQATKPELQSKDGAIVPVGINELLADMVAKDDIALEPMPLTLSNYHVRFDVPDPDDSQRAAAEFACKAINSFEPLIAALAEIDLRLSQAKMASGIGRKANRADFLLGEVARIQKFARAALTAARGESGEGRE